MKKFHFKKPDLKGSLEKLKNLKKEDIKEWRRARKARREEILEARKNSRFSKKMQPVYKRMNQFSVPLQYLLACVLNFFMEVISRHSFAEGWKYMTGSPKVFLFNAFLIAATFSIVYLFPKESVCPDPAQRILADAGCDQRLYLVEAGNAFQCAGFESPLGWIVLDQ